MTDLSLLLVSSLQFHYHFYMTQRQAFFCIITFLILMPLYKGGCTIIDLRPKATSIDNSLINPSLDPVQENIDTKEEASIIKKIDGVKVVLIPKATYKISARVMSKKHYYMDWFSKLAPVDLAVAWGPVASNEIARQLSFSISDRYASYHYPANFIGDPTLIPSHVGNIHIIPANSLIDKTIKSISVEDVIEVEGLLVNVEWLDEKNVAKNLNTSLTRDDIGSGACEILYVMKVRIKNKVYE